MTQTTNKYSQVLKKIYRYFKRYWLSNDLTKLARYCGTDKADGHFYTQHYARHFRPFKFRKFVFLEIGVGGYENKFKGGESLKMWKAYFPFASINAIDYFDKSPHEERRVRIFQGDQSNEAFLRSVIDTIGTPDIIIDDGSHINWHVIKSFTVLFPLLRDGGIYVIEDTQTSYWKDYAVDNDRGETMMDYFKKLVDGLNYEEFKTPGYDPTYFDRNIISMHFYHNLIIIYKGKNNEGSNILGKR